MLTSIIASVIASAFFAALLGMFHVLDKVFTAGSPLRRALFSALARPTGLRQLYRVADRVHRRLAGEIALSNHALLLQIRGQDFLTAGTNPTLRSAFSERVIAGKATRLLLLHPGSSYAQERANELLLSPLALSNGIRACLDELAFRSELNPCLQVRVHSEKPLFCISVFDTTLYLSFYLPRSLRQQSIVMECSSTGVLYQVFAAYSEWLWRDKSRPLAEVLRHLDLNPYWYEIEEKVKVVSRADLDGRLQDLGARLKRATTYRDHYFMRANESARTIIGEEVRIRCDLTAGRVYRTHKLPFQSPNAASKRQQERYVGMVDRTSAIIRSLLDEGYVETVSFNKYCTDYTVTCRGRDLQLTLAYITSDSDASKPIKSEEYLEVENLVSDDATPEALKAAYAAVTEFVQQLGHTVDSSPAEAYVSEALSWRA